MLRKILSFSVATLLMMGVFTACSLQSTADIKVIEHNEEFSYFAFPNTDWGMTMQEVMKKWDLKFEDVEIEPRDGYADYRDEVAVNVVKSLEVLGEKVDSLTFLFSYLKNTADKPISLGLSAVYIDYNYEVADSVMEMYKEGLGEKYVVGQPYVSDGTISSLPDKLLEQVKEVYLSYISQEQLDTKLNDTSVTGVLSNIEIQQSTNEPYSINVWYRGFDSALINTLKTR